MSLPWIKFSGGNRDINFKTQRQNVLIGRANVSRHAHSVQISNQCFAGRQDGILLGFLRFEAAKAPIDDSEYCMH